MKIVEVKTKKAEWTVYFSHYSFNEKDDGFEITTFYLLPSIKYFRDKSFDKDGNCGFDICFSWLFWGITISRCWGSIYEKKGE